MRKDSQYVIRPQWGIIVIVLLCGILSFILLKFGFTPSTPKSAPPEILLIICILLLCNEVKTIYLQPSTVQIRYHLLFYRREIVVERITAVELVEHRGEQHIIVSLDACPQFGISKSKSVGAYKLTHPIKAIVIRCWNNNRYQLEEYFECLSRDTGVIYRKTHK